MAVNGVDQMTQEERIDFLVRYLWGERSEQTQMPIPEDYAQRRVLLRQLVNLRPPRPVTREFLEIQDAFLQEETRQRGIVRLADIPLCEADSRVSLWQGDITRLEVDAIVNAANAKLLGCFVPGHACIDNTIHTFAGVQLRQACDELMREQGHDEPVGMAKITPAFNLPCRYVLHTVGPVVYAGLRPEHGDALASCYHSCLSAAVESGLESIAFCCISTGEFRFPKQKAAEIAVQAVKEFLHRNAGIKRVVFNVFNDGDFLIYQKLMAHF